ncbi:MAG TPA: (deoxy)nucleoside triphosphate pyrophosphohydrolase [Candidatus Eisenbacteria bacterium]|nr:(deoxy)nucleoside triphosphate pyrophosphohydrolase [Candidatus Eisenbacteria bacterium]
MLSAMTEHAGHPASAKPRVRVVAAVVWRGGELLITQRPPGGPLGGQWELPGGKIEPGETPEHALVREVREELSVNATALETLETVRHDYPHGLEVEVVFIRCELDSHAFTPSAAVHAVRWTSPDAIDLSTVLAGDVGFLESLGARRR